MHNVAQLRRLHQMFPNELVVIGVHSAKFSSEKLTQNIREAVLRHEIAHPVVNDAGFKIWNSYNVHAWPTVVLIDPNGEVVGSRAGEIDAGEFAPIIESMIAQAENQGILNRDPISLQPEIVTEPSRPLSFPSKLLVTPKGRIYVADTGHHRILEMSFDPVAISARIERVFGSGRPDYQDGSPSEAAFHHPRGLALAENILYVADTGNHAIRVIELKEERVRTIAGTGEKGTGRYEQGAPAEISLRSPWGLLVLEDAAEDGKNILFIAMAGTHQIWILLGEERVGVFAGNGREALADGPLGDASFNQPSDLALGLGHLLVADAEASAIRAISLGNEPSVKTLIGQGLFEFGDVDGTGPDVRLQHPTGIVFSDDSNYVYIADTYNHKIKRLNPTTGEVVTVLGTGQPGMSDGPFNSAELYEPEGLALYEGRLFIADTNNHLLRVADLTTTMLHTLTLRGLEKLQPVPASAEELGLEPVERRLQEVTVAPGPVSFTFDVQLPPGYKLNPDAVSTLSEVESCEEDKEADHVYHLPPDHSKVTLSTEVNTDCELTLDLTLYYCESRDERLCLIHDRRLILPIRVSGDAPDEARLTYSVESGSTRS